MSKTKRILITGANGGIGIEICKKFLQSNDNLILFYHENHSEIDILLKNNSSSNIETIKSDLSDYDEVENSMKKILKSGPIDIFIHSVTPPIQNIDTMKIEWQDIQKHIDVQTRSFFQIVKQITPSMREQKYGKIVCILSSYTVGMPPNNVAAYVVGKYSLFGLCKSLAVELGPHGINVNCVSPSIVITPLIEKLPSKLKELTAKQIPLRRLAKPEDVSNVVFFLCSNESDYVSGENFLISGGFTMH